MLKWTRTKPATGKKSAAKSGDPRRPHSIRFSDSEWKLIEKAAVRRGVPSGELVRSSAIAAAEDRDQEAPPVALSKGHAALIEEIYRFGYILATIKREKLLDENRRSDLNALVTEARKAMTDALLERSN